jgi:predicted acetylornithine/succinylornithine family transaminase
LNFEEIKKRDMAYVIPTYGERSVAFSRGKGVYLWDTEGKKYLDFVAGLSVNSLGYSHPEIVKAIGSQVRKLMHISNLYYHESQGLLAERLIQLSFPGKCFFANSGLEANEAAIKLCRKYGSEILAGASEIITMEKSFHGRSLATLAATGQDKIHKGFYPLVPGFHYARFNDIDSVKEKITPQTCAVMLEPVQGEGGIYVARKEFLRDLRALCSEKKILLVFDEVQCGLGRTGKFFAYEHYGLKPDVLTLAKAIASGIPMGVMIAAGPYSDILGKGNHASTFGGNPLACAVSLKVVEIISRKKFLDSIIVKGNFFKDSLEKLKTGFSFIKEVRGLGLMLGMEVDGQAPQIAKAAFGRGLLINAVGDNILRFLPPLVITKREISQGLRILEEVLKNI